MDLLDLCSVFTPMSLESDEEMQRIEGENKNLKVYTFGTVVESESGPKYKIESKGVVTVYSNVVFLKGKKEIKQSFESVLKLQKIRDLKDTEILAVKSSFEKRENNGILMELKELKN
jgi:hypothetical protein